MGRKEKDIPLSLEGINNLVSGMWLNCLYDESDENYYDTMFLTSDITRMSPDIVGSTHQNNPLGRMVLSMITMRLMMMGENRKK